MTAIIAIAFAIFTLLCMNKRVPTPLWQTWRRSLLVLLKQNNTSLKNRMIFSYLGLQLFYYPLSVLLYLLDKLLISQNKDKAELVSPVFICGTPRSGSTLLHRLLVESCDDLYGVTHFEWRYPSATFQYVSSLLGLKQLTSRQSYWSNRCQSAKIASHMHPNMMGDYEEDAILFEERMGHHPYQFLHIPIPEILKKIGSYSKPNTWNSEEIISVTNNYYHHVLQCMNLLKGEGKRFVSKEVARNDRLSYLFQKYPTAKFIIVTRDPLDYISSLRPLLEASTSSKTGLDISSIDQDWWQTWYFWLAEQAQFASNFFNKNCSSGRVLHVEFKCLTNNTSSTLTNVIDFLNAEVRIDYEEYMDSFTRKQAIRDKGYLNKKIRIDRVDFTDFINTFY